MNPDDRRLAQWARQTLWFDVEAGTRSDDEAQRILAEVYRREKSEQRRSRRRRRWGILGGAVIVAGGGVAAALHLSDQPSRPEAGVVCRASADLNADAVVVSPGGDPIARCEPFWIEGPFGYTDGEAPPLVACIGTPGAIEVFPGQEGVCETLGLPVADSELTPENEAILDLQERIAAQINAAECRPVSEIIQTAEQILAAINQKGWTVEIYPGDESGTCGKAAVDSSTKTINVFQP